MSEQPDIKRKKILWRTQRRGTKEIDILFGEFVKQNIKTFSQTEIKIIEQWCNLADDVIYHQLIIKHPESQKSYHEQQLIKKFRHFAYHKPKFKKS